MPAHIAISIVSLAYGAHYAAEHESRMLGHEAGESLPSDMLRWSFIRGASRQYDLLTIGSISIPHRWALKTYSLRQHKDEYDDPTWPVFGHSRALLRREWFLAYMMGSSVITLQHGVFYITQYEGKQSGDYDPMIMPGGPNIPTWELLEANLAPLGRIHVEGQEFAADHPVRGTPYTPVAIMLDHDHGWNPPRHLYRRSKEPDRVWGNIPYSRLDHQIDQFFRWVYPGYELSSFYRDERGYITNTPYGDLFDVILSNASSRCLEKYRGLVLLGDLKVEEREGLAERLTDYVNAGGLVVMGTDQWSCAPTSLTGAEVSGHSASFRGNVVSADGQRFDEAEFQYDAVRTASGDVLLQTEDGAPLVVRQNVGTGAVYLVTVRGWGKGAARHEFLRGIRHVLGSLLNELNLVEVEGRGIYYLANVTDQEDELILTLINNSPELQWEGRVRIKGQGTESFEAWLGHSEANLEDGALRCGVPATNVRIFKLKAGRPFLPLMFLDIDWKKLGVGISDTGFQTCPARFGSHS